MKKNLIIFLVLFFSYYLVNAQESEEVSYMNNITYTDNLDSNTVFNLNWNNFSKCSDLFVNSTKIEPLNKNDNTIISLNVDEKRYMFFMDKAMSFIPAIYICQETDNWTLTK